MIFRRAVVVWLGACLLAFPVALIAFVAPPWLMFAIGGLVVLIYAFATYSYVFPRR